MAEIIRSSVSNTLAVMFNISIEVFENTSKIPAVDDYVICCEFIQENVRSHILFLFDHKLIDKFIRGIFPPELLKDPAVYQSTASEIVNIVGNCMKQYLNLHGYHFEMAIPFTPDLVRMPTANGPLLQMVFSCKSDSAMGVDFYLQCA